MCPALASSWWGLSLQHKRWNVIILGIISLNHLGSQFLSGLLFNRVGTAVVEVCRETPAMANLWNSVQYSQGWGEGLLFSWEHALCQSHNQDHFQELGVTWFWTEWELQPSIFPEACSFFHYQQVSYGIEDHRATYLCLHSILLSRDSTGTCRDTPEEL